MTNPRCQRSMRSSPIREVAELQSGFSLLRNALKTFAQYVPLGIVRELVESGQPLGLGVKPRPLTIFFCDLENFSSYAESMAHPGHQTVVSGFCTGGSVVGPDHVQNR